MLPASTVVLIVGAGPTGLALALGLAMRGVPFLLVDRMAEGQNTSRAAVLHARTLECLEPTGTVPRLVAQGLRVPKACIYDRDRTLLTLEFGALPTAYPFLLMLPQDMTETALRDRLHELGGAVVRGIEILDLSVRPDGVLATVATGGGTPSGTIRARWIVGCDGMNSIVRQRAEIGFAGGRYQESFILADVRLSGPLGPDAVRLFLSTEGMMLMVPLPGHRFRIVATAEDARERPNQDDVQRLLDARGPSAAERVDSVLWSSRFRIHHRVADRFRKGRVLLAGDAAHVHSPAGGQGMNIGIQDALALAPALAAAYGGGDADAALRRYDAQRRPVAEDVVRLTDRMTRVATLRDGPAKLRNLALRALDRIEPAKRRIAYRMAELNY
ncbi:MAG: FAD-dependent monooxygenase [Alphaproteobacteria bacterium]